MKVCGYAGKAKPGVVKSMIPSLNNAKLPSIKSSLGMGKKKVGKKLVKKSKGY